MFEFVLHLLNPAFGIWTLVHLWGGVTAGVCGIALRLKEWIGFALTLVIALAWEWFEVFLNVEETFWNRVVDVLITLVLYVVMYRLLQQFVQDHIERNILAIHVLVLYGVFAYAVFKGVVQL